MTAFFMLSPANGISRASAMIDRPIDADSRADTLHRAFRESPAGKIPRDESDPRVISWIIVRLEFPRVHTSIAVKRSVGEARLNDEKEKENAGLRARRILFGS